MSHANAALTPTRPSAARPARRRRRLDLRRGGQDVHGRAAHGEEVGRPLPARRGGRDGRPQFAAASMPDQDRGPRWCGGSCGCGGATGSARSRSPAGSGCRPRPCTRCWSAAGSTGSPTSTESPANRCAATSTRTRIADPRRRHQVRQHPRRRRHALRRPPTEPSQRHQPPRTAPANAASGYRPNIGTAFVHTVIDDHSRVAYAEICTDEKAATAIGVLQRAVAWFAEHGVTVERVLSDNGICLPLPRLARRLRRARHHPQTHPALPAPDQRQDRTIPPHPGRRLGLRPLLRLRTERRDSPARTGSTSTITTESTPPSEASHRSAD